jgi:hypothetical protein
MVEQLICNQQVAGSIPIASSNELFKNLADTPGGVAERSMATDCKSVGDAYGGSNPSAPTILLVLLYSGSSSVVEHKPSKLVMWVRFPSPAPDVIR